MRGAKVDSDVVSDKLLHRMETPTESFHIHGLIQILPLYVGSYRRLRRTPELVLSLRQLSGHNMVSYKRRLSLVFKVNSTVKTNGLDRRTNVFQAGSPGCVLVPFLLPCCDWEQSPFCYVTIFNSSYLSHHI